MTNELLKRLSLIMRVDISPTNVQEAEDIFNQIKKDLEVLEILKNKMSYSLDYSVASTDNEKYLCALYLKYGKQKIDYISSSSRNFKKIKEWLENE